MNFDDELSIDLSSFDDVVTDEMRAFELKQQREEWIARLDQPDAADEANAATITEATSTVDDTKSLIRKPISVTLPPPGETPDQDYAFPGIVVGSAEREVERLAADRPHQVARAIERLRVNAEARKIFLADAARPEEYVMGTLAELLARPSEPVDRISGLLPWEAGLLLVAMKKSGKTTAGLNIARSLITGDPLFGSLAVRPISRGHKVAFINAEVSSAKFARWAEEVGIPVDRLFVINTRGKRSPFASEQSLKALADVLVREHVESLILDLFGRLYSGDDQDSNSEVTRWLDRLDVWARTEVGVLDVILTAHAGHQGEHVRGASSLEGWADANAWMTRDGSTRFLRAEGRDVEIPRTKLIFDPGSRALTLAIKATANTGGAATDDVAKIVSFLRDAAVPMSGRAIHDAMDGVLGGDHALRNLIERARDAGLIEFKSGPRRAQMWTVVDVTGLGY